MMTTPTTQFAPARMGLYHHEPGVHQISSMWDDGFDCPPTVEMITDTRLDKIEYLSEKSGEHAEDSRASTSISEKIKRRLAQNREAARKSRLRKKAYVKQLETSRLKLTQLELELERVRKQGLLIAGATSAANIGLCGTASLGHNNSIDDDVAFGIGGFERAYGRWIEVQEEKMSGLRNVLLLQTSSSSSSELLQDDDDDDAELLRGMVENVLKHYCHLFRLKREAARADAFYLVSGVWKTSVERFFLWIAGFRPSHLITVVMPQLEPLTEQQIASVGNLKHSCIQAEDALSQGLEKLQQTLAHSLTFLAAATGYHCSSSSSSSHIQLALDKLESMESFVHQADHLREQTLHQMSRILTTRQAAKGLLAFGHYFQTLRALSSLWSARPSPLQPPPAA